MKNLVIELIIVRSYERVILSIVLLKFMCFRYIEEYYVYIMIVVKFDCYFR